MKSCSTTRAGLKGISTSCLLVVAQMGERLDVGLGDFVAVAVSQRGFEQQSDREGQFVDLREPRDSSFARR